MISVCYTILVVIFNVLIGNYKMLFSKKNTVLCLFLVGFINVLLATRTTNKLLHISDIIIACLVRYSIGVGSIYKRKHLISQKILIIGGTEGIGLETTKALANMNAIIHVTGKFPENNISIKEYKLQIENQYPVYDLDLSNIEEIDHLLQIVQKERFDTIICNAAVFNNDVATLFNVNYFGYCYFIRMCLNIYNVPKFVIVNSSDIIIACLVRYSIGVGSIYKRKHLISQKILIIGGTEGIGLETTKALANMNAIIHVTGKFPENNISIKEYKLQIENQYPVYDLDLSNIEEIDHLLQIVQKERFDTIICNAAVFNNDVATLFNVNYFGYCYFIRMCLNIYNVPKFVIVNSSLHQHIFSLHKFKKHLRTFKNKNDFLLFFKNMNLFKMYAYTKFLQLAFINKMRQKHPQTQFYVCHPGICCGTNIFLTVNWAKKCINMILYILQKNANQSSWTSVMLASSDMSKKYGNFAYFSDCIEIPCNTNIKDQELIDLLYDFTISVI